MSKKNFGYTSISNIKRRLGTWDSRKPGQSPKEMKALLEGADKTLKDTKMKPESQGPTETGKLQDKRLQINNEPRIKIGRNYIYDLSKAIVRSNKSESAKVRDPLTIQDRSTGGPRKGHGDYLRSKHYKSRTYSPDSPTRTGVYGSEVTRNPSLRKSATDKVKDRVSLNKGLSEARDNLLYRRIDKDNTKSIKEANQQVRRNVTYRTPGKQRMLSGGKASGMSYIFKEMKRRLMKGTPGSHNKTY
jgi:hypothetical protein